MSIPTHPSEQSHALLGRILLSTVSLFSLCGLIDTDTHTHTHQSAINKNLGELWKSSQKAMYKGLMNSYYYYYYYFILFLQGHDNTNIKEQRERMATNWWLIVVLPTTSLDEVYNGDNLIKPTHHWLANAFSLFVMTNGYDTTINKLGWLLSSSLCEKVKNSHEYVVINGISRATNYLYKLMKTIWRPEQWTWVNFSSDEFFDWRMGVWVQ